MQATHFAEAQGGHSVGEPDILLDGADAAAESLLASLRGSQRHRPAGVGGRDMAALQQDMQDLDSDIASLEATLHSAGL